MKTKVRESRALIGGDLNSEENTDYETNRDKVLTKIDKAKDAEEPIKGGLRFYDKECGENGYHSYDDGTLIGKTLRVGKKVKESRKMRESGVDSCYLEITDILSEFDISQNEFNDTVNKINSKYYNGNERFDDFMENVKSSKKTLNEDVEESDLFYVEFENGKSMYGTRKEVLDYVEENDLDPENIKYMEDENGDQIFDLYAVLYD